MPDGLGQMKSAIARRSRHVSPPRGQPLEVVEPNVTAAPTSEPADLELQPVAKAAQAALAQPPSRAGETAEQEQRPISGGAVALGLRIRPELRQRLHRCAFHLTEALGRRVTLVEILEYLLSTLPEEPGKDLEQLTSQLG